MIHDYITSLHLNVYMIDDSLITPSSLLAMAVQSLIRNKYEDEYT